MYFHLSFFLSCIFSRGVLGKQCYPLGSSYLVGKRINPFSDSPKIGQVQKLLFFFCFFF